MKYFILTFLFTSVFFGSPKPVKVLIIGDSISIGYFPFVKEALKEKAEVYHNAGNAQSTTNGLKKLKDWLAQDEWDIIQFNWGLWDLAYRMPAEKGAGMLNKQQGKLTNTPEQYRKNLEALVAILKTTKAKLVFVNTTCVPVNEPGRHSKDAEKYNKIALKIMKENGVEVSDLFTPSISIHRELGLGADNVHYTEAGYRELSTHIVPVLDRIIQKQ